MPDNTLIRTSSVFYYLHKIGIFKSPELGILKNFENSIESVQGVYGYSAECFESLFNLIKEFGVYIFKSDLEGVLQTPTTKKGSIPLKALDVILGKIEDDAVPKEFYDMTSFISRYINGKLRENSPAS